MDMMSFMKPDVGLVLQMPYCCTRKGFAAVYEKVGFIKKKKKKSIWYPSTGE